MANMIRVIFLIVVSMLIGYFLGLLPALKLNELNPDPRNFSLLSDDFESNSQAITRTAILNTLADRYGYRSYLEIGQGDRKQNHDWIECAIRIGVDPQSMYKAAYKMTSDEFFAINNDEYDLVFIDGLHEEKQVHRDIINALQILSENGTIVVHDCNPPNEAMQIVPPIQDDWTGDVWKAWVKLRASRSDLRMYVINAETGCGIIRRGSQKTIILPEVLNYEGLDRHRQEWLNLVNIDSFLAEIGSAQ